jgi:uncharacterized protein YodC (DUF2158 family)
MFRFKPGDLVQLTSGGPTMAVSDADYVGARIRCQWLSGSTLNQGSFRPEELNPAEGADVRVARIHQRRLQS